MKKEAAMKSRAAAMKSKKLGNSLDLLTEKYVSNLKPLDRASIEVQKVGRRAMDFAILQESGMQNLMKVQKLVLEQAVMLRVADKAKLVETDEKGRVRIDKTSPGGGVYRTPQILLSINEYFKKSEKDAGMFKTVMAALAGYLGGTAASNPLGAAIGNSIVTSFQGKSLTMKIVGPNTVSIQTPGNMPRQ